MPRFFPKRRLSFSEIILIPETSLYLFVSRLTVSYLPPSRWMPKDFTADFEKPGAIDRTKALLVAGIINGLEARTPWKNTCLVKALAAHRMLKKREITHELHFGVAPKGNNELEAHAWLSVGNEIILGGENVNEFHEISRIHFHSPLYI